MVIEYTPSRIGHSIALRARAHSDTVSNIQRSKVYCTLCTRKYSTYVCTGHNFPYTLHTPLASPTIPSHTFPHHPSLILAIIFSRVDNYWLQPGKERQEKRRERGAWARDHSLLPSSLLAHSIPIDPTNRRPDLTTT